LQMPYVTPWPTGSHMRYMDKGDFTSALFIFEKAVNS